MAALTLQVDGSLVEFSVEGPLLVGRDPASHVCVQHELASRRHLELRFGPTGWTATDLGTRNGTFSAGERLGAYLPFRLFSGSVLHLGDPVGGVQLRVLTAGAPVNRDEPVETSAGPSGAHDLVTVVGRAPDSTIVVSEPLVSAHHARFTALEGGGFVVEDLRSSNGTYVDGVRVDRTDAPFGSVVSLGGVVFELTSDGVRRRASGDVRGDRAGAQATALRVLQASFSVPRGKAERTAGQGRKVLVDRVSFDLPYRSLLAVIGPSGAGKSTLLRLLTGAVRPDHGQILLDGLDLAMFGPSVANRIGVVPQDDLVHPELTTRQALDYAARLRFPDDSTARQRSEAVSWAIAELGLQAQADTRVDRLSGGQRKRVSTAMELLTKPELLFLDEPTSGLDPNLDREVMGLLRELAHGTTQNPEGRTVVVITHATDNLDKADLVLLLAPGGKVAYFGSPDSLRAHFAAGSETQPSYADIYAKIEADPNAAQAAFVALCPPVLASRSSTIEHHPPVPSRRRRRLLPQTIALLSRQARLMVADRSLLLFTTALPVTVGLLTLAVRAPSGFNPATETDAVADPRVLTVVVVFGAVLMGLVPSVRQLVAERPIFVREAGVGVRASAYLASKIVLLGAVCAIQSALMVAVALTFNPHPQQGLVWPLGLELFCVTLATSWCCAAMGLLLSGLVSTSEQVMPLMVLVLMFQLVMCGGVITVTGPGINQMSLLSPSRWGFAAVASSLDFNRTVTCNAEMLAKAAEDKEVNRRAAEAADEANRKAVDNATKNGLPEPAAEMPKVQHTVVDCAAVDGQDPLWGHTGLRLSGNLLALGFWFAVYCCGCWVALRQRNPWP